MKRGIRESREFREQCEQLDVYGQRIDAMMAAATLLLPENAELCDPVPGTELYWLPLGAYGSKEYHVYFSLDDSVPGSEQVDLQAIETEEGDPDEPLQ